MKKATNTTEGALLLHANKVYEQFSTNEFVGWKERPVLVSEPCARYVGHKISWDVWRQVISWFQKHAKDEVQVRLFLNRQTGEWKAEALPQYYPSGMTTSEIEDSPKRTAILEALTAAGFHEFGTIHHHCSASAFQSSTDARDEKDKAGIHITVGKMDEKHHDLHGRVTVRIPGRLAADGSVEVPMTTMQYGAIWSDWFDLPPNCSVPDELRETVITYCLGMKVDKKLYPKGWDDMLEARQTYSNFHNGYGGFGGMGNHTQDRTYYPPSNKWWQNDNNHIHGAPTKGKAEERAASGTAETKEKANTSSDRRVMYDIKKIASNNGVKLSELNEFWMLNPQDIPDAKVRTAIEQLTMLATVERIGDYEIAEYIEQIALEERAENRQLALQNSQQPELEGMYGC